MEGGTNGQTDSLPAGCGIGAALDVGGVSFFAVCREGIGDRGCFGEGVVFLCNI